MAPPAVRERFKVAAHGGSELGIAVKVDAHGDPYVLMRPTRAGDLNLDGLVTIADFINLAAHFFADRITKIEDIQGLIYLNAVRA